MRPTRIRHPQRMAEIRMALLRRRPEFGGVVVHADNAFAVQIIRPEGQASGINMGTG